MSKFTLSTILLVIVPVSLLFAQSGSDPLHWSKPIKADNYNTFLLWSQKSNGVITSNQKVYRYQLNSNNVPPLDSTDIHTPADTVGGNGQMDVAAGYFQKSAFENVVAAWEGTNQHIHIMIPHFDSTSNMWSTTSNLTVAGPVIPVYNSNPGSMGRIFVRTGDFLGKSLNPDSLDQFVLGYEGADSLIHIQVYGVDDNLMPHLIASAQADTFDVNPSWAKFSIATGDLNGDGKDEIVLTGLHMINNEGRGQLYTKIYELNNSNLVSEGSKVISAWNTGSGNVTAVNFGASTGHFTGDNSNEIGLTQVTFYNNTYEDFNTYFLNVSNSFQMSNVLANPITKQETFGRNGAFSIASGDLNGDGRDELVFADMGNLYDCGINSSGSGFINKLNNNFSSETYDDLVTYDYLSVGDINQDGKDDIVISKGIWSNSKEGFELFGLTVKPGLTQDSTLFEMVQPQTVAEHSIPELFHYATVLGNFNGYSFRIGKPEHFVEKNVAQPVAILNAPPVHFDILNSKTYDLSNCFSGSGCTTYSTYTQQNSTSKSVTTVIHNDYGEGAGIDLKGQFETAPAGVGASVDYELKIEGKLGADYKTKNDSSFTVTANQNVQNYGADFIYETVTTYDLWQYPIYEGTDPTPYNYYMIVVPQKNSETAQWVSAKSFNTAGYVPTHENSNILSYPSNDSLNNNPEIEQVIPLQNSPDFAVTNTSSSSRTIQVSSLSQTSADSSWNAGFDMHASLAGVLVDANYDHSHLSTQSETITSSVEFGVNLGELDSLGEAAAYHVKPYLYHSKNGALVLDYAVDPDIASPGTPATWWTQEYGQAPDPTFILPWLYDPQKGNSSVSYAKQHQTADISFSSTNPSPGDMITITARIRNFSLVGTGVPVPVRFYIGNPDSGGVAMVSTNGDTVFTTAQAIGARNFADVRFNWHAPASVPANLLYGDYIRIYAVIDPNNKISEIHKNNNMGWNTLEVHGLVATAIEKNPGSQLPTTVKLYPNYPNPFNPTTTIHYVLPKAGNVKLTVYNVLGQRVAQLVSSRQTAGNHEIRFNADQLSSGVYFYRLQANNVVRIGKMMLIK